ncbi:uncharacterized protein [Littorina saxatilis]|uniref:Uncharacterized protein n=1 Tax=Littorina saxatilis TaxID=31220 RepID=A0AAN9FVS4_9CAEN
MADLPIAAIVCIAVGCYVLVLVGIIVLCYVLKGRGSCGESHCCAKDEDAQSCECCLAMAEACNCCKSPSITSCLDACCPNRKRITCVDIIMCQCCASEGGTMCDGCCGSCCGSPGRLWAKCTCQSRLGCCKGSQDDTVCNCLCLEIRMRSPRDKDPGDLKLPAPTPGGKAARNAWSEHSHNFRTIPALPDQAGGRKGRDPHPDLQLDLGYFHSAPFPISTHPLTTNRSETSGDFIPSSTPRFHQGQSQLFIRPGVHSAGRVIAKRQSGPWPPPRRSSSRRRSRSRRSRSPSRQRSLTTNIRPIARRYSQREPQPLWVDPDLL